MNIRRSGNAFVIYKSQDNHELYFSFFVDGDRSSWSQYLFLAARFKTVKRANEFLSQIKERERIRRRRRLVGGAKP